MYFGRCVNMYLNMYYACIKINIRILYTHMYMYIHTYLNICVHTRSQNNRRTLCLLNYRVVNNKLFT